MTETDVVRRPRDPSYTVFVSEDRSLPGTDTVVAAWVPLGSFAASSRKAAIRAATVDLGEDHQYGLFATALTNEFRTLNRGKRVTEHDEWT